MVERTASEVRLSLNRVTSKASSRQVGSRHLLGKDGKPSRSVFGVVNEGFFDETYQVDVSVGTPPQRFNLTLDTFKAESFLFAKGFTIDECSSYIANATRRLFDPSASTTHAVYAIPNDPIAGFGLGAPYVPAQCSGGIGDVITTNYDTDTFQVGDLSARNTSFVLVHNFNSPLSDDWPSDGVFGLALWDSDEIPDDFSTIEALLKSAKQATASVFLTRPTKTSQLTERGGALLLGGKDTQNCDSVYSPWISVDTIFQPQREFGWGFSLDSFSMGSYVTTQQTVQLQSQTTFIYAPTQVFKSIVRLAGAEYDFKTDRYTVKCSKAKSLPAMVFTFGSFKYSIPATDYVRMVNNPVTLPTWPMFFKCCDWILGTTFNFEYCHLLDYGNKRIAFAKALAPKSG